MSAMRDFWSNVVTPASSAPAGATDSDQVEDTPAEPQACEAPDEPATEPQVCQPSDETPTDPQVCREPDPQVCREPSDEPSETPTSAAGEKTPEQEQQEQADFEALMALREGNRTDVYLDSLGKPTVGIGHLVVPGDNLKVGDKISKEQVTAFFKKDSAAALSAARAQAAEAGIKDSAFISYLASVNFQLGTGWTGKFPKTWKMIVDGQYEDAAKALDGTAWAKQTPVRVKDFQDALRKLPAKS
jgi:lysozyme